MLEGNKKYMTSLLARNIRAAVQNLNELVEEAYAAHEIIVQYEIKAPCDCARPSNSTILATILQEV
jgi:hypothetical protein